MASSTQTFAKILELMEIAPTYFPELKPKFLPITRQVRNAIAQNDATDAARAGMVLGAVFTKHEKQLASIVANAKKKENGIAQDELIREAVKSRMRQNRCESVTAPDNGSHNSTRMRTAGRSPAGVGERSSSQFAA